MNVCGGGMFMCEYACLLHTCDSYRTLKQYLFRDRICVPMAKLLAL